MNHHFGEYLTSLGRPEDLTSCSEATTDAGGTLGNNAHIHLPPNFSAFETIQQAVALAEQEQIQTLGVNNYYDFSIYGDFALATKSKGIFPLFGLEAICLLPELVEERIKINDPGNPGKMYLCGKGIMGFSLKDPIARALLQTIRENDLLRMTAITARLEEVLSQAGLPTGLTSEKIKVQIAARHEVPLHTVYLQERHVAQAFQEALFEQTTRHDRISFLRRLFGADAKDPDNSVAVQNQIRTHLLKAGKPAYLPDTYVGFDHVYALILALGGIPCYPVLADGTSPLCSYEQDAAALACDLQARGIFMAEFIPARNSPSLLTSYVRALRAAGIIITAGTEHNTQEMLPLKPSCRDAAPIPSEIQEIFQEGASVVAAHQFLTAHGQTGYITRQGQLSPGYGRDEERIRAFYVLGRTVIAKYRQQAGMKNL